MLLGTLGASLLGDLLIKNLSVKAVRSRKKIVKAGEGFLESKGRNLKKSSNSTTSSNKF